MNFSFIVSIILIITWIITGLSGSGWFWLVLLVFPIVVIKRFFPKIKLNDNVINITLALWIFGFIFILTLVDSWELSFGEVITFIYIVLFFLMIWKVFSSNKSAVVWFWIIGITVWIYATSYITSSIEKTVAQRTANQAALEKAQNDKIAAINTANSIKKDPISIFLKELEAKYQNDDANLKKTKNIKVNTWSIEFTGVGIKIKRTNEYSPTITWSVYNTLNSTGWSSETYFLPQYTQSSLKKKIPTLRDWNSIIASIPGNTKTERIENFNTILWIKKLGFYDSIWRSIIQWWYGSYFLASESYLPWSNLVIIYFPETTWKDNQTQKYTSSTEDNSNYVILTSNTNSLMYYPVRLLY